MRNLKELNINVGGKPVARPPPTVGLLLSVENAIHARLPDAYKKLLLHTNGGHPELDSFVPDSATNDDMWAVDVFYHLEEGAQDPDSIFGALARWQPILGGKRLPVARDGGNNQIFLDCAMQPAEVWLAIADEPIAIRKIAKSFEEFIDKLQPNPEFI